MAKTVLIVDDDKDIQFFYEVSLSGFDIKIIKAYNGEEALKVIDSKEHIDLIILDRIMPVLDGIGFLKIIRDKRKMAVPVILSTVDDITADDLLRSGKIQDYFIKLDNLSILKKLVKKYCGF